MKLTKKELEIILSVLKRHLDVMQRTYEYDKKQWTTAVIAIWRSKIKIIENIINKIKAYVTQNNK